MCAFVFCELAFFKIPLCCNLCVFRKHLVLLLKYCCCFLFLFFKKTLRFATEVLFFRKHLVVLLKYSSVREGELGHFNYTSVMYLFVMLREREREREM